MSAKLGLDATASLKDWDIERLTAAPGCKGGPGGNCPTRFL